MKQSEQITHFSGELDALVNRFILEYSLSYAAIVGTLEIKKAGLVAAALAVDDEDLEPLDEEEEDAGE